MARLKLLLLAAFVICLASCKDKQSHTYAIKDFRKSIQPLLLNVVSKGIVTHYAGVQASNITNAELIRLGKCENPLLRAIAYEEMLERSSFYPFDVVKNHLDDTAMVVIDEGEFGMGFRTVADFVLRRANWESFDRKDEVVDLLITRHNYLGTAYTILPQLEPGKNIMYTRKIWLRAPGARTPMMGMSWLSMTLNTHYMDLPNSGKRKMY